MKLSSIIAVIPVSLYISYTSAQPCPGRPQNPTCVGHVDLGREGFGCVARTMWHFDGESRRCHPMHYRGCVGNNNRWCTRAVCEQRCRGL